jgi:hypothetical protein
MLQRPAFLPVQFIVQDTDCKAAIASLYLRFVAGINEILLAMRDLKVASCVHALASRAVMREHLHISRASRIKLRSLICSQIHPLSIPF